MPLRIASRVSHLVCLLATSCGLSRCADAGEPPPSGNTIHGQPVTLRPLLPPGPLGPLVDVDDGGAAATVPLGVHMPGNGGLSNALAQPAGTMISPEQAIAPGLAAPGLAAPPGNAAQIVASASVAKAVLAADAAEHKPEGGCGCAHCAAGGGGPHVYASESLPMFAPTELESFESGWLPDIQEDWCGRPDFNGAFSGVMLGGDLVASQLKLDPGLLAGLRFGQDVDRRWGWESRIAYGNPEVVNLTGPELRRDADMIFADSSLFYSRYATRRLRPFVVAGLGMTYLDLVDHRGERVNEFLPTIPIGAGIQYRVDEWLVFQLDVRDQIMLGSQADWETVHNLALSAGLEIRFGGLPNVFYPQSVRAQSAW